MIITTVKHGFLSITAHIFHRFASRSDAGCVYWLRVRLVDADMQEIDKREIREEKDASGDWFHVILSLSLSLSL